MRRGVDMAVRLITMDVLILAAAVLPVMNIS